MQQIDHRVIKLLVGIIAISLALFMQLASGDPLASISESYHHRARDWFVGLLFAVGALFLSFKGEGSRERRLTILASLCAVLVATAPCACGGPQTVISTLHYLGAGGVFAILGYFCWRFRRTARDKTARYPQAKTRVHVYTLCLWIMVACGVAGVVYALAWWIDPTETDRRARTAIFWIEAFWLGAFGLSWLAASRTVPGLANPNERFRLLDGSAPEDQRKRPPDPNDPAP